MYNLYPMKKIFIITLEYPPQIGGIASYVYNFARHLEPEQTVVYAPKMKGDKEFDAVNPWKTYRLRPYWAFIWPHWLRLLWQVRKIVKLEKPELIMVHHALPSGYVAYYLKKTRKIPYQIFLHGTDVEAGTKTKSKTKKLNKICREAQKVVVNSEFTKSKLLARLENLTNVEVFYPCPAEFFFQSAPAEAIKKLKSQLALEGKKVILTVARLVEGKGYPHLIRLLPEILNKIPNIVWLVIGDGPKKKAIMDLVQKYSLQNIVRYLGEVPYQNLPLYYQSADLFVLLTHKDEQSEEGWGTVFLEAGASGLPVVAGRVGGVEEVVANLQTGLLVDIYQDAGVISAVVELLHNEEYAKKMGAAGRERAQKEFNWDNQIRKLDL